MKTFAAVILSALFSCQAWGQGLPFGGIPRLISLGPTITQVGGCVNSASATTTNCTSSPTVTSGNLLIAIPKAQNSSGTGTFTITNTGPTCNWVRLLPPTPLSSGNPYNAAMYGCILPSSGTAVVTATSAGTVSGPFTDISVSEWHLSTGSWNPSLLDRSIFTSKTTASTSCASGSTTLATQNPNDLLIGICENFNAGQTWAADSPFVNSTTSSRNTLGLYSNTATSTGIQSVTIPMSASDTSTGILVAIQASTNVNCASCALVNSTDSANETPQHDQIALSGVTAGDTLVYYVYHSNWSGSGTTSMTDSGGNLWRPCDNSVAASASVLMTDLQTDSTHGMACFYSLNVSQGGTITGQPVASDCTVSCTLIGGWFAEIKGATAWDAFNAHTLATASSGTNNATCGTLTTTVANDFIFCSTYPDSGFSSVGTTPLALTQSNSINGPAGYALDASVGSISPTMTYTSGTAYGGMAVAFK